jgi:hypothetical protein
VLTTPVERARAADEPARDDELKDRQDGLRGQIANRR